MPVINRCTYCQGQGCLGCGNKGYFYRNEPDFTARIDNPDDMRLLKEAVGREALEKAYEDEKRLGIPAVSTINRNIAVAAFLQAMHEIENRPRRRTRIYKVPMEPIETPGWDRPQWPKRRRRRAV